MTRDLRRQPAERHRKHVGEGTHREQSAGDFAARMTRTREEMLDEKRHHEQKRQDDAAQPPGDGSPKKAERGVREELEKQDAVDRQNHAGTNKSSPQNN